MSGRRPLAGPPRSGSDLASSGEQAYEGFAWAPEDQQGEAPKSERSDDGTAPARPPASATP